MNPGELTSGQAPRRRKGDGFPRERLVRFAYLAFCTVVFVFLVAPILVIVPLSFNAEPYFTFTEGMLRFDPAA